MPAEPQYAEKRRSERVLLRVPIHVQGVGPDGSEVNEAGETAVVNRHGALLRLRSVLKVDSRLSITHSLSGEVEQFRVVWVSEQRVNGLWDTGVEALSPRDEFWGVRFPPAPKPA